MAIARSDVTAKDVADAAAGLAGRVRETPVLPAGELSRRVGAPVLLKAENLQLTGSFKVRGALAAVDRGERVIAASAGNHAQAVAYAAREGGGDAVLVMPARAPVAKVEGVRQYGGEVRLVEGGFEDAVEAATEIAEQEDRALIPAYDHPRVVAGQGSVGLEIARQAPDASLIVVPLGGGGLASGIAIACPGARVVGVRPESPVNTICDGIAVKKPGVVTRPLLERHVDEIVSVSDDEVAETMVLLLERSKLVVEGAGAVGAAALLHGHVKPPADGDTCVILSGGNVDASLLAECIRMGETAAGRRMVLATKVPDRPGELARLLDLVADHGANVMDVEHLREGIDLHVRETAIQLVIQTRGRDHGDEILRVVADAGFSIRSELPRDAGA
jgi:threonine dehydratase